MGVVLREEIVWVIDLGVRVSDFESFRLSDLLEWVSDFESDFERAERSLSEWECLTESVSVCLNFESVWERRLKVLDFLVYGV